jgi:hypothetical protein
MSDEEGAVHWIVYILECADNTLYTGITTDLDRRLPPYFLHGVCNRGWSLTRLPGYTCS